MNTKLYINTASPSGIFMAGILAILVLLPLSAYSQNRIEVDLYETTKEFIEKTPTYRNAVAFCDARDERSFVVDKFIDPISKEKIKYGVFAWALEYKGDLYINMNFVVDHTIKGTFVKVNRYNERYCIIYPVNNVPPVLSVPEKKHRGTYYGTGLTMSTLSVATKYDEAWRDSTGHINTIIHGQMYNPATTENDRSNLFVLSRKYMKKTKKNLDGIKLPSSAMYQVSFEEAVEYFESKFFKDEDDE